MESTTPKKLIAISDIHGRYNALRKLVDEKLFIEGYKFVFMGDYFGYGKQSIEVIEYLTYLKLKYGDQVVLLYGNWEDMIEEALFGDTKEIRNSTIKALYSRGFGDGFKQIKYNQDNLGKVKLFFTLLNGRTAYIDGDYCFVHAGVYLPKLETGNCSLEELILSSTIEDALWAFDFIEYASNIDNKYKFVVGHVPVQNITKEKEDKIKPFISGCVIGINFGASKVKGYLGYIKFDENGKFSYKKVPSLG